MPMLRAALLALLVLAPFGFAPGAAATCDPLAQVCWDEGTSGHCSLEGAGWSTIRARNVMLGFPVTLDARGQYICAGKSHVTRDIWTNATAGTAAAVYVHWQTQETGWRWIQVRTVAPLVTTTTDWWGSSSCNLETRGSVASAPVSDRRACPSQALPPQQPDVKWGNVLP